jgi:conjugal transfer/type IV secretion protein DotA/TraY
MINLLMGTHGLFDMCRNTDINPLAQLSALGKGLVEHSIRAFGMALGLGIGAGVLQILNEQDFVQTLQAATSFLTTIAGIGLVIGFLLFYVLPFLPFIYFFFAVMTWVKGIFQAMVGMPLWALAHLRIDGEGMPGESADIGYFYILETFLRPVCIILGFLGGIVIFTAMVKVLNEIFYVVISNLSGHQILGTSGNCFNPPGTTGNPSPDAFDRGPIDEFFYTVMYAILVYMISMPCFKMVDMVPDNIMRWMGSGVKSFGARDGDPAEGLMQNVSIGASMVGGSVNGMAVLGLRR